MAALYQRLSGKINTSHSFPLAAEASRLLSAPQAEDGTGTEVTGGQEMKKTPRNQSQCNKVANDGNPARSGSVSEEYELSTGETNNQNWKGMAIALLVIIFVCSLIVTSIVLLTPAEDPVVRQAKLSVDDLFMDKFILRDPGAHWLNERELAFRTREGHLMHLDVQSNETAILLANSYLKIDLLQSGFTVSPDQHFLLLAHGIQSLYSHSNTALYSMYDLHSREFHEVKPPESESGKLQFVGWGPRFQQLVLVHKNNLYYQEVQGGSLTRLTHWGKEGMVYCGLTDWLYQEEVLHSRKAHWWSPNGGSLAFLVINNTGVPNAELPRYTGGLYPNSYRYPYPKAGQPNPSVRLFVAGLTPPSPDTLTELLPPLALRHQEYYLLAITWLDNNSLAATWLNRPQNLSLLSVCDTASGNCIERHRETSEAWLFQQHETPVVSTDGETLFLPLSTMQGGRGAFRHLAAIPLQERAGQGVHFLTSGDWEVTSVLAMHPSSNAVYYLATETSPTHRHLYSVETRGAFERTCLTCDLLPNCSIHRAEFSPEAGQFLLYCDGPAIPSLSVHNSLDPSRYLFLNRNSAVQLALSSRQIPSTAYHNVTLGDTVVNLRLTLPPGFSEDLLHPLLLYIVADPGGQSTDHLFSLAWETALSSEQGAVVAKMDGHGTCCHGSSFLHATHRRLGVLEESDQQAALRMLLELPYIDKTRVGIYGRGYGGFVAGLLLASKQEDFRCGVLEAPIVDFALYASAFSERYLGLPSRDENVYEAARLTTRMSSLKLNKLLLMHNTADDLPRPRPRVARIAA
uniref:A-type potassium channel modulatory protein DPP6-like isoform X2 n=1 Tax=Myxine glutinosa TaxID=7769 RepID=UPI00358FC179